MARRKGIKTCGDFGGQTRRGKDCAREAGWGTDHKGRGRCKVHEASAREMLKARKERFIEVFVRGTATQRLAAACVDGYEVVNRQQEDGSVRQMIVPTGEGVSTVTVWRWRQDDSDFDEAVSEAQYVADSIRLAMAEDSVWSRIWSGDAPGGLTEFMMVNASRRLGDNRYLHKFHIKGDVSVAHQVPLQALRDLQEDAGEAFGEEYDDDDGA